MGLVFNLIVCVLTIIISTFAYFKWKFLYWRNKNVPYIQPRIPFGTTQNPLNRKDSSMIMLQNQYQYFKSMGCKYGGLYLSFSPAFLPVDVELLKNILSKDFQYFTDRGAYYNEKADPTSATLFHLEGPKWRTLRVKLTSTFTSGKMKMMFPTLVSCADPLYTAVNESVHRKIPIDIKDFLARFTTDVIGSCAFGLECNSFQEDEGEFRKYGQMCFDSPSKSQAFKFLIVAANPHLARSLGISLSKLEVSNFFFDIIKKTVYYRQHNNVRRNDFLQLLLDLKNTDCEGLTIEEISAQSFVFFLAGFETSSTTMTFCLYELAINQDIQEKVRNEINEVLLKHGEITYDAIMEMKYLNQVVEETLRKYPPLPLIIRSCVQDYKIPGSDVILEKGTRITIPVYALHHDEEYFPNPDKFEPDRFSDVNKSKIIPFSYIPFGEGPRACIGLRFGLLQSKVGLAVLLKNFKFLLNNKTKSPLEYDRLTFTLVAEGGVWVDVERVSKDVS